IKVELKGKILLPILGDQYGVVLERGELKLTFEDGGFYLHYYEFKLPITPNSVPLILAHDLERLKKRMPTNDDHLRE
ncbi:MAG: hypothetical protein GWM98_01805, partial [Nitrospinaceae bacterium]|nr:hypothetical protein [Nitrospinaceae bacterium]NIR53474.1 hypothetical protein [Nitrospinaceae bacterium]NIS83871.1 hypothetical protein [Nitrospinaceae bacterium]NIT80670.1 hypothetical protein [Nitrospinaceae bacterium]NIU42990.1 hypothetical protein [Nitrospinaceae bacterium]